VLVESCNWTENSVPFNESEPNKDGTSGGNFVTGNREWGVWIKNKKIAVSFYNSLIEDFKRGTRYTEEINLQTLEEELYEVISVKTPPILFPSASFTVSRLLPLLTPDNYFQNIKEIISKARHSIYIQQQYVKPKSSHVSELLDLIKTLRARNQSLDVKIIVSPKVFGPKQKKQLESDLSEIAARFGLKLGENIRFLNLNYFIHCHNKGILVDDEISIIASQNWSETGIGEKRANREAGIVIYDKKLNSYFSRIFKSDWKSGTKSITVSRVIKRDILPNTIEQYGPSLQFAKINPGDHVQL
jgi:phosphatidylserine/phosphatidylglycerophosphate/cardiolipin synthase-like enzyme